MYMFDISFCKVHNNNIVSKFFSLWKKFWTFEYRETIVVSEFINVFG